ncbi:hypothetical protein [Occallatibacter riparius]|uniref:DoxX family protein n=1 Tax=Occallatibacter riparius TaxID=1002689 RepID=A0A9J7BQJ8_9BACT|nr:hypothetical protein [Occallatibacter riparius]UWZ84841.1 hypothetical protein MOP44_02625 [Occallatibacter riparius]
MIGQVQVVSPAQGAHEGALDAARWSLVSRIGFRFVFSYLVLYGLYVLEILWFFLVMVGRHRMPSGFIAPLWHVVVPWFGHHVLHLHSAMDFNQNGSGDTTYEYTLVFCELLLAALATVVWSLFDRKRPHYKRLYAWIRLPVRLLLAAMMFTYGSDKMFMLQFGRLTLADLARPFGEMSPPTLMWNFMAASPVYTIFAGCVETLGGILLLFPQTVALGAIVVLGAMTNVVFMDLSYDVGVKALSAHFALFALFLLADRMKPLADLLIFNRSTQAVPCIPLARCKWIDLAAQLSVPVLGTFLLFFFMFFGYRAYGRVQARAADRSPLYGIWDIDSFTVNGQSSGPLLTPKIRDVLQIPAESERWQRLVFEDNKTAVILLKNKQGAQLLDTVQVKVDPQKGSILFTDDRDSAWKCTLDFQRANPSRLAIQGEINGSPVSIALHLEDDSRFLLRNRGVHWIIEQNNFN